MALGVSAKLLPHKAHADLEVEKSLKLAAG